MLIPESYINLCEKKGIPLSSVHPGSDQFAWHKSIVLSALALLDDTMIAVLGVEIMEMSQGELEYVYDFWSVDKRERETIQKYIQRSREEAKNYIEVCLKRYEDPYFVLVISEYGL